MIREDHHDKMIQIIRRLEQHEKDRPELTETQEVQELFFKAMKAYLAEDYDLFLTESRKLARIYKGVAGPTGIPVDRGEQEGWEVGSDHR